MQETWVQSLVWKDPPEEDMATHSNILAWRVPWTEEPGRLQCMGSQSRTRLSDFTFFLFSQSQAFCCSTPRGCTQSVELYFIVSFLRSRTTHPGSLVPTQGPACGLTCHNERMD